VGCEPVAPLVVSEPAGNATAARLAWNGGGWGVAWSDDRDGTNSGDTELYFARLDTAGEKMGADVRVTDAPGFTTAGSLVYNGTDYAVVFNDARTPPGMYFTRVDAAGDKLFDEVLIEPGQVPRLAWNGTEYGLSYTVQGIVQFVRLDENGAMLGTPTVIGNGYNPSLAPSSEGWAIAFHFGVTDFTIYFVRLDASGQMVGGQVPVRGSSGWHASLAASGDGFGVAWNSGFTMGMAVNGDIHFARLDASGAVMGSEGPVTMGPAGFWFPSLAAGDDGWGLAWVVDTDLEVAHIDAAGAAGEPAPLSDSAIESFFYMQIAARAGGYGVVWPDSREGNDEVFFATTCP
jgi:hypothetical protein